MLRALLSGREVSFPEKERTRLKRSRMHHIYIFCLLVKPVSERLFRSSMKLVSVHTVAPGRLAHVAVVLRGLAEAERGLDHIRWGVL